MNHIKLKDVTDLVTSIMGDVVEEASVYAGPGASEELIRRYCEFEKDRIELIDSIWLHIKLKNGKEFTIYTSEWGGLRAGPRGAYSG